jgi:hypothetical protein
MHADMASKSRIWPNNSEYDLTYEIKQHSKTVYHVFISQFLKLLHHIDIGILLHYFMNLLISSHSYI